MESGLCECGCGEKTRVATRGRPDRGHDKGQHYRFIPHHHLRKNGKDHPAWKGGRYIHQLGYIQVQSPDHTRADRDGYVLEHIIVAEKVLARCLVPPEEIHHVDKNPANNAPPNLVICEDRAYHSLLHVRIRALCACGNANWRTCVYCKEHDDPANMYNAPSGHQHYHRRCRNEYDRKRGMAR